MLSLQFVFPSLKALDLKPDINELSLYTLSDYEYKK